jgi:hypothetical protein
MHKKGTDVRTVLTINSRITLRRQRYYSRQSGSLTPVDVLVDAAHASFTVGLREMCARVAVDTNSFERAAANLKRTAQVETSDETLRTLVEADGQAAAKLQAEGKLKPKWSAQDCLFEMPVPPAASAAPATTPPPAPPVPLAPATPASAAPPPAATPGGAQTAPPRVPVPKTAPQASGPAARLLPGTVPAAADAAAIPVTFLCAGLDGVMAPMVTREEKQKRYEKARQRRRKLPRRRGVRRPPLRGPRGGADERYKELKVAGVYDQKQKHRLVRVTRRNCRHAGRVLAQVCEDVRFAQATLRSAVADGAEWIAVQLELVLAAGTTRILDFFHLAEHVHTARRLVFGETDKAGEAWTEEVLHTVRHEGYDPFWEKLVAKRAQLRSPSKRAALDALMNYVSARRGTMDYPRYEKLGLPIGSGPTEAMCKVVTRRLKGVGMRWNYPNAEAMSSLEAMTQSDLWETFWEEVLAI